MILIASRLSHNTASRAGLISHSFAIEPAARAYSSPEAVVLNHVGGRSRLSPHVLSFASATKAPTCMGFTDLMTSEGWKAVLDLLAD